MGTNGDSAKGFEFKKFATPRIIAGIAIAIIVLWALIITFSSPEPTTPQTDPSSHESATPSTTESPTHAGTTDADQTASAVHKTQTEPPAAASGSHEGTAGESSQVDPSTHAAKGAEESTAGHTAAPAPAPSHGTETAPPAATHEATAQSAKETTSGHALPTTAIITPTIKVPPKGVAFVEATIAPLEYELEDRWWGWRPNDIIDVTDNVNNFQLGVLEVTRRTIVALADRITRYGTTDAYDPNLEDSMNWIMVKAGSYWFPSAESKYREALDELRIYNEKLKAGKATFYTRSDNLIPLLTTFEDLLGSCDTNLAKELEEDGTPVSFFSADDYFYYSKGVASSMATVLEAVLKDFRMTLESRHAAELVEHAIEACHRAAHIEPLIILDRDLDSILANHRANMAAPISHARFYVGQLIKTLST